jgi:AraC family transcriptional regulator of adaptative response / DNA-3-methyladenine glycosylase II
MQDRLTARCRYFLQPPVVRDVHRVTGDVYVRSVLLDGVQGTVAVEPTDGNALRATVRFPKLSALPFIIARLRRVFDLAADPVAIAAHLAKDPALAPLVKARPGLRVPGAWDGFELATLCWDNRSRFPPLCASPDVWSPRMASAWPSPMAI